MSFARFPLLIFALAASVTCAGHNPPVFTQNMGQWHDAVDFRIAVRGGYVYLDSRGLTVDMLESDFFDKLHQQFQGGEDALYGKGHVLKIEMIGADFSQPPKTEGEVRHRQNFFLGNDPSRWAGDVRSFTSVTYSDIYPGVDLVYRVENGAVKYDYWVAPGGNPDDIAAAVSGGNDIYIREGNLVVETSVGEYRELKPFAYQTDAWGRTLEVPCEFQLDGLTVGFRFPEGFDPERTLVIDPEIAFSSYVGSVSDNFGFTATYDEQGNLYAGAIVFGSLYPITAGAYQHVYGGGNIDCGITKFSADGTELLYSTFFGGSAAESPHSMMVNENNELYVLGTTGSTNLPTFSNSIQNTFAGGSNVAGIGFNYSEGSDMFVARFSADGTELLSSTYLGGSGNDGMGTTAILNFNYGDIFRGELVVDSEGFVYLGSVSTSNDFPIVGGFADAPGAVSSGVVAKLNPELTQIVWSTFTGGSGNNAVYGIQVAPDGSVYATGGTTPGIIAGAPGGAQPVYVGGLADGFVQRIAADGSSALGATFCGTSNFDQNYFVQLDNEGFAYVVGQSKGNMPISDGVYANPGSKQFIQKYAPNLDELIWSTQVGSGTVNINISPSAFLVTHCNQIYLSGWGGSVNGLGQAGGNTLNMPITPDAFQPTTDGSDFYLMVLDADASDLVYGTYFGGGLSSEHVDGGTSRFDKDGTVYQAVCAGCGGNDDFPTQPGVWSQTNDANNCNLGVFKFKLSSVTAVAEFESAPAFCVGDEIAFMNLSSGANSFLWDFGDGNTSQEVEPTYAFEAPGTYEITLYAEDTQGCLTPDSTSITVEIAEPPAVEVAEVPPICAGETVQLFASGADEYSWSPAEGLSSTGIPDPTFSGTQTTTYTVTGSAECGSTQVEVTVTVGEIDVEVQEEVALCPGESFQFNASGGTEYAWSPDTFLDSDVIANPTTTPGEDITYTLTVTDESGCEGSATVQVQVLPPPPTLQVGGPYVACNGNPVQLFASGGGTGGYAWSPETGLDDPGVARPFANPIHSMTYTVTTSNECGTTSEEVLVKVSSLEVSISADSVVCYRESFPVFGSGAIEYRWSPSHWFADPQKPQTTASIPYTQNITLTGYNADGCHDSQSARIRVYPRAQVDAGPNRTIYYGEEIRLQPYSPHPILWESSPHLSCLDCLEPIASPLETTWFYATILSPDGCLETDSVRVRVHGNLYVPNAFTPDGDGINDIFRAEGVDIVEFRMEIFNRWGELIFRSDDIAEGWNGQSPNSGYFAGPGVYPYRIVAREHGGDVFEVEGHVVLIR